MKAFIDISSDKIAISTPDGTVFLDRNGVENEIGKSLIELDKKYSFDEYIVLNGPGGFTNLRVGTLALNLLKTLKNDQIKFYSISKPLLYSYFHKNGWIPRYGILYIGQKSNVWVRDIANNELVKMIKKSEIDSVGNEYGEVFLDQVYDENYFGEYDNKLHYIYNNGNIFLTFKGEYHINLDSLNLDEVEKLEPNYMIEPNVS